MFITTEIAVAAKVAEAIFACGLAAVEKPADVRWFVEAQVHEPK